jgi:phage-related protein
MMRNTRPISWIRAALKEFSNFPDKVQHEVRMSLTILAEGQIPDNTKPLKALGAGVQEIVTRDVSGTYRVIYALKIDADIWVVHVFKKKTKTGIKTPKSEVDFIKARIKQLKEKLK